MIADRSVCGGSFGLVFGVMCMPEHYSTMEPVHEQSISAVAMLGSAGGVEVRRRHATVVQRVVVAVTAEVWEFQDIQDPP